MVFANLLLKWYDENGRSLPWRGLRDAYTVWASEIILQQTRIEQGIGYFYRFVEAFPDVYALAAASEGEVLRVWQGLGYYSRARNMHETARNIVQNHEGRFPDNSAGLIKLKGVGTYTAAAIASIVYNENVPAIDGNAYRVLARFFGMPHNIDTGKGQKAFIKLANQLVPVDRPGDFNQGLMDYGSIICKPVNPLCSDCIFQEKCIALQQQNVEKYPVRNTKRGARKRYFNYFFFDIINGNGASGFFIRKRTDNDIWKNMYELPLLETKSFLSEAEVFTHPWWKSLFPDDKGIVALKVYSPKIHQLTHQRIYARLIRVKVAPGLTDVLLRKYELTDIERFETLAKPRLIEKLLMIA